MYNATRNNELIILPIEEMIAKTSMNNETDNWVKCQNYDDTITKKKIQCMPSK